MGSAAAVIVAGLAIAGSAAADDLYQGLQTPHTSWSLFAGAAYTDNADLTDVGNAPHDTIAIGGVSGSFYRDTGRLKADVDGSVQYQDYLDHTFTSHTLGQLVGMASYAIVPDSLNWVLKDTYGQVNVDPLVPPTPNNRINANYVLTGPDANLRLGGATELLLGARYGQADYQTNPFADVDSRTWTGNLGLLDRLSLTSSVSLNATAARVEYRAVGNPLYDQYELYGRFDSKSPRGGIALDLGGTELRENGSSVSDPLARLTLFHRLTAFWNVNVTVGTQFLNTGTQFQSEFTGVTVVNGQTVPSGLVGTGAQPGAGVANVILAQNAFRSDYGTVAFDFVRPRTSLGISGSVSRQRYQFGGGGLDRDLVDSGAYFTRRLRPTLEFHAAVSYDRQSPQPTLPGNRTWSGETGFVWRPGALLAVTLTYDSQDRTTDTGGFPYRVDVLYLGLSYGPPKPRLSFAAPGQPATQTPTPTQTPL
jgi:hypothetical protein